MNDGQMRSAYSRLVHQQITAELMELFDAPSDRQKHKVVVSNWNTEVEGKLDGPSCVDSRTKRFPIGYLVFAAERDMRRNQFRLLRVVAKSQRFNVRGAGKVKTRLATIH
jgi:hypothetical protein